MTDAITPQFVDQGVIGVNRMLCKHVSRERSDKYLNLANAGLSFRSGIKIPRLVNHRSEFSLEFASIDTYDAGKFVPLHESALTVIHQTSRSVLLKFAEHAGVPVTT